MGAFGEESAFDQSRRRTLPRVTLRGGACHASGFQPRPQNVGERDRIADLRFHHDVADLALEDLHFLRDCDLDAESHGRFAMGIEDDLWRAFGVVDVDNAPRGL
jgi:hypothetical protein